MSDGRTVALVLGSGGARGYAHIGVIQVLLERGHDIVAVSGASMGALVGGIYSAGKLDEFTVWANGLSRTTVLRLMEPKFGTGGAVTAGGLMREVRGLVGDVLIEDLPIPYTAVATDLLARREVWFQRGSLASAVRASIAIPGVITPVVQDDRIFADGGLMNPVPIDPTAAAGADLTIAVSLQGPRSLREQTSPRRQASAADRVAEWTGRMRDSVTGLAAKVTGRPPGADEEVADRPAYGPGSMPDDLSMTDVLSLSSDAMQGLITRYRMAGLPPDVLIEVPVSAARSLDLHRAKELVPLGRELANAALDAAGL